MARQGARTVRFFRVTEQIPTLIEARDEMLLLNLRSQLAKQHLLIFVGLGYGLGSERLTGAALDRLTHRCQIIETTGERYRHKDAQRRRRKKTKE